MASSGENDDRAPRFVIVGVQKCGTTALYDYLCLHSQVRRAVQKETHFFDWRLLDAERSGLSESQRGLLARWRGGEEVGEADVGLKYRLMFPLDELLSDERLVSGEATPSYLLMGRPVAERLRRHCPGVRLIVATRDPVRRALSQYNMTRDPVGTPQQLLRRGFAELGGRSYAEVIEAELEQLQRAGISVDSSNDEFQAYLDGVQWRTAAGHYHGGHSWLLRGIYSLQVRLLLEYFPPEAVCVVRMEDLAADANAVMAKLHRHVGVVEEPLPADQLVPKNARTYDRTIDEATERLERKMADFFAPFNAQWQQMCQDNKWL